MPVLSLDCEIHGAHARGMYKSIPIWASIATVLWFYPFWIKKMASSRNSLISAPIHTIFVLIFCCEMETTRQSRIWDLSSALSFPRCQQSSFTLPNVDPKISSFIQWFPGCLVTAITKLSYGLPSILKIIA